MLKLRKCNKHVAGLTATKLYRCFNKACMALSTSTVRHELRMVAALKSITLFFGEFLFRNTLFNVFNFAALKFTKLICDW